MSELANRIRHLRGDLSQLEFAKKVQLSHRTITKIEAGFKPKRRNILQIAEKLEMDPADRMNLLLSWMRAELGDEDFELFNVKPRINQQPTKSGTLNKLHRAAANLRSADQELLLLACNRRNVLNLLSALNDLYEEVNPSARARARSPRKHRNHKV